MATLSISNIRANLQKKGFVIRHTDHEYFHLVIDNKKTSIRTHISHGEREISDSLIAKMSKQTRLSIAEFKKLVECPLTKDEYVEKLVERGFVVIERKQTSQ